MCCLWLKGEISWEDSYWPAQTVKCVLATITDNNSKLQCTFSSIWQYQPCCTLVNKLLFLILLFINYLNSLVCIFVTDLGRGSLWFQPLPVNTVYVNMYVVDVKDGQQCFIPHVLSLCLLFPLETLNATICRAIWDMVLIFLFNSSLWLFLPFLMYISPHLNEDKKKFSLEC